MDTPRLVAEARQLRTRWDSGDYVSVAIAVSLANRLADVIEANARPETNPRSVEAA
jgi:hypothetical protein